MQVITQFLKMESLLDDSVGQSVELELERGGKSFTVQLMVSYLNFWFHVSIDIIIFLQTRMLSSGTGLALNNSKLLLGS